MMRALTLAFAVAALALTASPASAQEDVFEYTVREGDTCANLAQRIWGHSSRYERIHALNTDLGPQPHRLRAGQTLRLPERARPVLQGADAEVTAVQRRVESRQPSADRWNRAQVGQDLFRGARVNTHERASAAPHAGSLRAPAP